MADGFHGSVDWRPKPKFRAPTFVHIIVWVLSYGLAGWVAYPAIFGAYPEMYFIDLLMIGWVSAACCALVEGAYWLFEDKEKAARRNKEERKKRLG